jgi:transketolase
MSEIINNMKRSILITATRAQEGHIPSAFSILDILWILYDKVLKSEDIFVLSKGHGCMALYAVMAEKGIIPQSDFDSFCSFYSPLGGHPDMNKVHGIEASTGSLGHGLPIAVGMTMALGINKKPARVYCLIGDGECNEGSIWESLLIASHHNLTNLTCIVDYNHSTDRALKLDDLSAKFQAFGWAVCRFDGHDHELLEHFLSKLTPDKPNVIIAETIKGKGIGRMENNPEWHHKSPTKEELEEMLKEL